MLGREDPFAMMNRMPENLFRAWMDYWAIEPFGPGVQNLMAARIAANSGFTPRDEEDFLPRPDIG